MALLGKKTKTRLKQFRKAFDESHRALWRYRAMVESCPIDENVILLESQQGRTACGNMFYVLRALLSDPRFDDKEIFFVVKPASKGRVVRLFETYGFSRVKLVSINTAEYVKLLVVSKYLITDTSFPSYYVKRDGQVIWNTWHGTPLKHMGRKDEENPHNLGNVQKNLALADYLSFPNKYTAQHMIEDYMLENICSARILYAGYPRNEAFFQEPNESLFEELGLSEKRVYAYMPTWRPRKAGVPARYSGIDTMHYLMLLDDLLTDDELMLVSIHPLARKAVHFGAFTHIKEFPPQYETYEVLAACDALVTDYSSVLFDFASSKKKVVLFDYDRASYLKDRGLYLDLDSLPFPKVQTPAQLILELRSSKSYDDASFIGEFCPYEDRFVSAKLCGEVFFGDSNLPFDMFESNERENVVIYAGNLAKNGITSSLHNLLNSLDLEKRNYFLTFETKSVSKNRGWLKNLPDGVSYLPRMGKRNLTLFEKIVAWLYQKKKIPFALFDACLTRAYEFDFRRTYGFVEFDSAIQFNGYDYKIIYAFSKYPARRVIFVHNNMIKEAEVKGNQRLDLLRHAYNSYDKVAVVSQDLIEPTREIAGNDERIVVVTNQFDYLRVLEMAKADLAFDPDTVSSCSLDELKNMTEGRVVLVTIGRFSPEKQHLKLIKAFDRYWKENNDACLIIVGGVDRNGLYAKTCELAASLPSAGNIAVIKSMSNPYSLLRLADGFVLPSMYEGLGLVLLEADALGIPVASTDVCGPRGLLSVHGGVLVDDTEDGIYEALVALGGGFAPCLGVDFEDYNRRGLESFEAVLGSASCFADGRCEESVR